MGLEKTMRNKTLYSVWVGGGEVNDYLLSYEQAKTLADQYRKQGYTDVVIEQSEGE
jgi:hypothetical protein